MRSVKQFVTQSADGMVDYLFFVSTEPQDQYSAPPVSGQHDRLQAINSLRERAEAMPILHREALPSLPYLLDLKKV